MDPDNLPVESSDVEVMEMGTPLGGNTTIEPIMTRLGAIEAYNLVIYSDVNGDVIRKHRMSKAQGERIISERVQMLLRKTSVSETVDERAAQALMPAYIAHAYQKKLRELGYSEEKIPQSIPEMIALATKDLESMLELGKVEIANTAQRIEDEILSVTWEVLKGNKSRYLDLPDNFRKQVDFLLPSITALAAEKAGFTRETLEVQKMLLAMNLMAKKETADAFYSYFTTGGTAAGVTMGNLIGSMVGSVSHAYNKAKNGER